MLLTVPILYYKPIQQRALKIKAGRKDRREERRQDKKEEGILQGDFGVQKQSCFIHV